MQNGKAYTLFYEDVEKPDGTITTERARHLIGDLDVMSERAARREHDLFMADINKNVGLHAFRHGLATELAQSEPITVLQTQMRHADVRTTLMVYAHVIPQAQRDSMERIAKRSIGTNVPIGTGAAA